MRRTSKLCLCALWFILFVNTSCSKRVETMTVGEWLVKIVEQANIPKATNQVPYYLNITKENTYFDAVQASVEWEIIDTKKPLVLDKPLTKDFIAYSLVNLMNEELDAKAVKDASKSDYPEHCAKAVSLGLFQLDHRELFNPKEIVSSKSADDLLMQVIGYINDYEAKDSTEFTLNEEIIEIEVPLDFDEEQQKIKVKEMPAVQQNDIIHWYDVVDQYYRIENIDPQVDYVEIELSEVDYFDLVDEAEIDGSFEVDFSKASITSPFKEVKNGDLQLENMAMREFEFGSFSGTFQADREGIQVRLKRKQNGGELISEIKLYGVKPTIRWKTNQQGIQDGYFKIDFSTLESIKLQRTEFHNYYSDFKNFKGKNLLDKMTSSFHQSNEMDGVMIPICDIQVPIPNIPLLTLGLKLQVHIYTNGKIELVLTHKHLVGCEIRNNKLRTFYDHDSDVDFIVKANANSTLGVTAALMASKISLMDIGIKGGIEGHLMTTVHLIDNEGKLSSHPVDGPLELIDEAAAHRDDVKVCGDIKLNWILRVIVNSGKTVANKFGLTKSMDVLNKNNASLIPLKRSHLENWQFVEKCTRTARASQQNQSEVKANKILLHNVNYLVKVNENKQIQVNSVPPDYEIRQLTYESQDESICTVDHAGKVKGVKKGSCTIRIKTIDEKYTTLCHILVS